MRLVTTQFIQMQPAFGSFVSDYPERLCTANSLLNNLCVFLLEVFTAFSCGSSAGHSFMREPSDIVNKCDMSVYAKFSH